MFHFPGCPPMRLWIHLMVTGHYPGRVPPFGNSGINVHLQLPRTYRSLSRPSSAISALASTLRSFSLDLALAVISFLRLLRTDHNLIRFVSSLCSFQGAFSVAPSPFRAGRSYAARYPAEPVAASRMLRILPRANSVRA